MLTRTKVLIALALLNVSMPLGAAERAQISPAPASRGTAADSNIFLQLDANNDGMITRAEAERSATVKVDFSVIDRNRDGILSRQEWVQYSNGGAQMR